LGTLGAVVPTGSTWQLNFQINSWQWNGPGNTDALTIDNVALTDIAPVPEPAAMALLPLGLCTLWVLRNKSRR